MQNTDQSTRSNGSKVITARSSYQVRKEHANPNMKHQHTVTKLTKDVELMMQSIPITEQAYDAT